MTKRTPKRKSSKGWAVKMGNEFACMTWDGMDGYQYEIYDKKQLAENISKRIESLGYESNVVRVQITERSK